MERMADVLQTALNRKVNAAAHELLPMEAWDAVLEEKGELRWKDISKATGRPPNHNWHVRTRRLSKRIMTEIAKALSSDRLMTLVDSDVVWDPIVSIESEGVQPTYDLTIEGHHNFVANDIIVHNSSLAMNIATNVAAAGEPVALFSLEMSKEEIVQRILSSVGKVDSMKLRSGQLGPLWQRVVDAAGRMYQAPIFIDDSPVVTVTDIRAKCRRLKRKKGLSLIVVDYIQLMEASGHENRQQEIAQISRNLKNLARELEVPVIAMSQLNRSLESREDKRPRLSDLRESGSLEQDADVVMFIYRHEYYHPEEQEKKGIAEVIVAKHRAGSTGPVELTFQPEFTRFANLGRDVS
jgi:replicative DNA helicase